MHGHDCKPHVPRTAKPSVDSNHGQYGTPPIPKTEEPVRDFVKLAKTNTRILVRPVSQNGESLLKVS